MASAAAVATNASRSPLPFQEQDDVLNTTGTITSADTVLPDEVPNDDDEDDDDIARPARRKQGLSNTNGAVGGDDGPPPEENGDDDDDLFGSEPDDDESSPKPRLLDDEELDSGDDEGGADRLRDDDEEGAIPHGEQQMEEELTVMDADMARHPVPEPSDGELYLLKVPRFLSIAGFAFDSERFTPPVTDHHSKEAASETFSATKTAQTTVRWRPSPSDPSRYQSNARILRWSDGSLTLQIANDPQTQYTMKGTALAPPQLNPRKPTLMSAQTEKRKGKKDGSSRAERDTFTYLTAPQERAGMVRITNKFTTSITVEPAVNTKEDAVAQLQRHLAQAAGSSMGDAESAGIGFVQISEDPELAKKKAEQAEKEKLRAQKRRETQEQKDRERGLGRSSGYGRRGVGYGGGLTVGGLEDDEDVGRAGSGRLPPVGGNRRKKPRSNRRGEILTDEEEEYGRRNRTKEDEYDEEDDFVAPSDEEEEVGDESEDDIDEGINLGAGGGQKADVDDAEGDVDDNDRTSRAVANNAASAAAPGVDRDDAGSPQGRGAKRRRVIEDEDEE